MGTSPPARAAAHSLNRSFAPTNRARFPLCVSRRRHGKFPGLVLEVNLERQPGKYEGPVRVQFFETREVNWIKMSSFKPWDEDDTVNQATYNKTCAREPRLPP